MQVFISYKFTGESLESLESFLTPVKNKFEEMGINSYCNFFDEDLVIRSKEFKKQDWVFDAFRTLNNSQLLFVLLTSEEKSEGMILEVGYAIARGIPIVVAIKSDVKNTYLHGMANLIIDWADTSDLLSRISKTDFTSIKVLQ